MTLPERANRKFLFVDMNSFFASCEQADHPELRGKPVIIVPTEGSCALSASYEAKKFGIYTTMSEKEARFCCPEVVAVRARPKRYMEFHYQFASILNNLSPRVKMRSVDEASLELFRNEDPVALAQEMKEQIWRQMSPAINCSVGIAPNIFLAKLATELQKPNGLVEIRLENLLDVYRQVGLRDLCGINYAMERQLQRVGIFTVTDFYQTDPQLLREWFGVWGHRWWLQLHGYPSFDLRREHRSLSHSHVLPPHLRQPKHAYVTAQRLVAKVGRRLRKDGYLASTIALHVRYADRTSDYRHLRITPASDTITLSEHLVRMWREIDPRQAILKLSVWTTDLKPDIGMPTPLFEDERKKLNLSRAIDRVNDKHGVGTIRFAITDTEGSHAPDRISFTALFEIEHE